jgi:hypothetical protein
MENVRFYPGTFRIVTLYVIFQHTCRINMDKMYVSSVKVTWRLW